jgi:hypothetical protein
MVFCCTYAYNNFCVINDNSQWVQVKRFLKANLRLMVRPHLSEDVSVISYCEKQRSPRSMLRRHRRGVEVYTYTHIYIFTYVYTYVYSFQSSMLVGVGWSTPRLCRFTLGEKIPGPIAEKAGWAPRSVWKSMEKRKHNSYTRL